MQKVVAALVVITLAILAIGLIVPASTKVQIAAQRTQCTNNLRQIGLSLHSYQDVNRHLPAAGIPTLSLPPERQLSWIVALHPYIEATNLYRKMDPKKGWDDEENRYLGLTPHALLRCPGFIDRPASVLVPTDYVGITGIGADAISLPMGDPRAGVFGYERKPKILDILGTSRCLTAMETSTPSGAWSASDRPTARGLAEGSPYLGSGGQFGGIHDAGANALFADATARFLDASVSPKILEAMALIKVGKEAWITDE